MIQNSKYNTFRMIWRKQTISMEGSLDFSSRAETKKSYMWRYFSSSLIPKFAQWVSFLWLVPSWSIPWDVGQNLCLLSLFQLDSSFILYFGNAGPAWIVQHLLGWYNSICVFRNAWVAQWLSICLWLWAWSQGPRIESPIGSLLLPLPMSLSLSVSLMNK